MLVFCPYVLVCTRVLLVCCSYVLACTRMLPVCYLYVLVCNCMLLVCTRMYSCGVLVTILFVESRFFHSIGNKQYIESLESEPLKFVSPTHDALRMFIMQVLASQLHFLTNKNAELAIPPLFWQVNCMKIGGHIALLSDPTVYSLYCAFLLSRAFLSSRAYLSRLARRAN